MSQCLIQNVVGAYCTYVRTFDSTRPHTTTARITSLWNIQTQNLLNANISQCFSSQPNTNNAKTSIINTDVHIFSYQNRVELHVHIFSYQNRVVLQQERQHLWGHNWHMAPLQHIASKWHNCFMKYKVQAAKQWLLYSWPNIQIQGSFIQQRNTLRRGTVFWPWCMGSRWYMWLVTALQLGGYGPPSK